MLVRFHLNDVPDVLDNNWKESKHIGMFRGTEFCLTKYLFILYDLDPMLLHCVCLIVNSNTCKCLSMTLIDVLGFSVKTMNFWTKLICLVMSDYWEWFFHLAIEDIFLSDEKSLFLVSTNKNVVVFHLLCYGMGKKYLIQIFGYIWFPKFVFSYHSRGQYNFNKCFRTVLSVDQ